MIKKKSKCMRCGGVGHWAGDPSCKFPGARKGQPPPKPPATAYVAFVSDSSDEADFPKIASGVPPSQGPAAMVAYATPKAKPSRRSPVPVRDPDAMSETPTSSQVKGKGKAKGKDALSWTVVSSGSSSSGYRGPVSRIPTPKTKAIASKTPPNPPSPSACEECAQFNYRGSTAYAIRKTCIICGHAQQHERDIQYAFTFGNCPHEVVDRRGSSKATSRVFCKQCGNFIQKEPMHQRKARLEIAKRIEELPEHAVHVVANISSVEAEQDLFSDTIEWILADFVRCVQQQHPTPATPVSPWDARQVHCSLLHMEAYGENED